MTATPTPSPEVEALIERLRNPCGDDPLDYTDRLLAIDTIERMRRELAAERKLADDNAALWWAEQKQTRALRGRAEAAEAQRDRLASRVERLRGALEPFARIAFYVEYTDKRDGNVVHRQRVIKEGKPASWMALTKDDFRTARAAYEETQDGE